MANAIRTRLIKIGNSQGVRIPKPLIEQLDLGGEIELWVDDSRLIIQPAPQPRAGWDEAFRAMAEHGDDQLLDGDLLNPTEWDETEWQW